MTKIGPYIRLLLLILLLLLSSLLLLLLLLSLLLILLLSSEHSLNLQQINLCQIYYQINFCQIYYQVNYYIRHSQIHYQIHYQNHYQIHQMSFVLNHHFVLFYFIFTLFQKCSGLTFFTCFNNRV